VAVPVLRHTHESGIFERVLSALERYNGRKWRTTASSTGCWRAKPRVGGCAGRAEVVEAPQDVVVPARRKVEAREIVLGDLAGTVAAKQGLQTPSSWSAHAGEPTGYGISPEAIRAGYFSKWRRPGSRVAGTPCGHCASFDGQGCHILSYRTENRKQDGRIQ
jgi:hypothetical protein